MLLPLTIIPPNYPKIIPPNIAPENKIPTDKASFTGYVTSIPYSIIIGVAGMQGNPKIPKPIKIAQVFLKIW